MKLIAIHTVKAGGVYYVPGADFDVPDDVGKALVDAGAAGRKTRTVVEDDERKPLSEVLAMAENGDVSFPTFRAAAGRILGDKMPSKKDEIVAALLALPPEQ